MEVMGPVSPSRRVIRARFSDELPRGATPAYTAARARHLVFTTSEPLFHHRARTDHGVVTEPGAPSVGARGAGVVDHDDHQTRAHGSMRRT